MQQCDPRFASCTLNKEASIAVPLTLLRHLRLVTMTGRADSSQSDEGPSWPDELDYNSPIRHLATLFWISPPQVGRHLERAGDGILEWFERQYATLNPPITDFTLGVKTHGDAISPPKEGITTSDERKISMPFQYRLELQRTLVMFKSDVEEKGWSDEKIKELWEVAKLRARALGRGNSAKLGINWNNEQYNEPWMGTLRYSDDGSRP